MTYEEFINKIAESDIEDWIYDDEVGSYVFRKDIAITMQRDREEDELFEEEWVERFIHHSEAKRLKIYLNYMGNTIDVFFTASVDGAQMNIPYPNIDEMAITRQQYNIGKIVNKQECGVIDRYDEYLRTARITVK